MSGWTPAPVSAGRKPAGEMRGMSVGLSRYKNQDSYVAVVAEVSVDTASGAVRVLRMWSATDTGRVTKVMDFGAFIELAPGIEGLVHVSECAHERIPTPAKVLTVGEGLQVKVLSVHMDRKRISPSRKALLEAPAEPAARK